MDKGIGIGPDPQRVDPYSLRCGEFGLLQRVGIACGIAAISDQQQGGGATRIPMLTCQLDRLAKGGGSADQIKIELVAQGQQRRDLLSEGREQIGVIGKDDEAHPVSGPFGDQRLDLLAHRRQPCLLLAVIEHIRGAHAV